MRTPKRPLLSPWRSLLTAVAISNVGDGIYLVAFPLLAATITSDPRLIAGLGAVAMIPNLLFALPAGVLVDRLDRPKLMIAVDLGRTVLVGILVCLIWTGSAQLWHLFGIALLLGCAEVLFDTAGSAYVPNIVATKDLPGANGRLATVSEMGNGIIGPAVGGLLFASAAALPFAIDAVSFLAAAALVLYRFRSNRAGAPDPDAPRRPRFWREAAQGVSWLWRHRDLRAITIVTGAWNLFGWMPEGIFVLYVKEELRLGSLGFGLLFAAASVGAVVGGLLSDRLFTWLGPARVLALAVLGYSLFMIPPAFLSSPVLIGLMFFLQGVPLIAWSSVSSSIRQTLVPDELRGRVGAVARLMGVGMAPLGFLLGGVIGGWLGLRSVFVVGGVGIGLAFLANAASLKRLSAEFTRRLRRDVVETG